MNHNFESIPGALELSHEDLMLIQGGSIFGDAWRWGKEAVSDAGHAIGSAAKSVYHAVSSKDGQKALKTGGAIASAIAGIIALF